MFSRRLTAHSDTKLTPEIVETRKRKHREAQARYREKNANSIRLKRFLQTKKGQKFQLDMLGGSAFNEENQSVSGTSQVDED